MLPVDPRCADELKRLIRSPTNGQVRHLDLADAQVKQRLSWVSKVGRRIDPRQRGLVEPHAPPPAGHLDNSQIAADLALDVKHLCQFANRHAVSHRQPGVSDEVQRAFVCDRPVDRVPTNRVGPIEHHHFHFRFRTGLHAKAHGRNVSVVAGAGILDIEHQHIHIRHHLRRRLSCFAVQAVDMHAGRRIDGVSDFFIQYAVQTMLGREDLYEFDVLRSK